MANPALRGHFLWHDLMTPDPQSAAAFYAKALPWRPQTWDQDPNYTLWMTDAGPMSGVMATTPEAAAMNAPPVWTGYIGTPNVHDTVRQIRDLGGKVLREVFEIPTIGHVAIVADPQGATFAAFTPFDSPRLGSGLPTAVGDFGWHELATGDTAAAFDFYGRIFGWERGPSTDMGEFVYEQFMLKGQPVGGMYNPGKNHPLSSPYWLHYVNVGDAKQSVKQAQAAGAQLIMGPVPVPGGAWIAQLLDPQGGMFALMSMPAAGATNKPAAKKPAAKKPAAAKPVVKAATKKASPKTKAKPKAKVKAKTKAKVKAKTKTKVKARSRKSAPAKKRPAPKKANTKVKARVKTKAKPKRATRAKPRRARARGK